MTEAVLENERQLQQLIATAAAGWRLSAAHQIGEARKAYRNADAMLPEGTMAPDLSVLRHNLGTASGLVVSVPPTEDRVVAFVLPPHSVESPSAWGMTAPVIDTDRIEQNIRTYIAGFNPGHHAGNIVRTLPHVMVLSTGRCGTVSLYHLFAKSRLLPYHSFWWLLSPTERWEMMCRMMSGTFDGDQVGRLWAATRAAEWLGAMVAGRPMVGLNHLDTIFAPTFAAIHSQARFVHLRRDPIKVFESFYGKAQWGETQLRPMFYGFAPEFRFRKTGHDLPACIAWYVHFTEIFARAFGRVMGNRFIEISSDRLFARDRDEITRLVEFVGAGIPTEEAEAHFASRINEKAHKAELTAEQMDEPRRAFSEALSLLQSTGRL